MKNENSNNKDILISNIILNKLQNNSRIIVLSEMYKGLIRGGLTVDMCDTGIDHNTVAVIKKFEK